MKLRKKRVELRDKRDQKKEEYIRALIALVESAHLSVRRERLKRGPNWSAQSGICTVKGEQVVFIDRTVSQDDQLEFLTGVVRQLDIPLDEATLQLFPKPLQKRITGSCDLAAVA